MDASSLPMTPMSLSRRVDLECQDIVDCTDRHTPAPNGAQLVSQGQRPWKTAAPKNPSSPDTSGASLLNRTLQHRNCWCGVLPLQGKGSVAGRFYQGVALG